MRTILFIVVFLLSDTVARAGDVIRATLEPSTNRSGWFVMHITNMSTNTIRFLNVREGTHACGDVYAICVEKDGISYESKFCAYSPFGVPEVVELAPGHAYDRAIQPNAYGIERHLASPYTISVKYRITDNMKTVWSNMTVNIDSNASRIVGLADVDLKLVFRTEKFEIGTSNNVPEDTARKFADPPH